MQNPGLAWSLPDRCNTTTDVGAVDEIDDYETQVYIATRALLDTNNTKELEELQRRARERVAWETDGVCKPQLLYPQWDTQRREECGARTQAALSAGLSSLPYTPLAGPTLHFNGENGPLQSLPALSQPPAGPPGVAAGTNIGFPLGWPQDVPCGQQLGAPPGWTGGPILTCREAPPRLNVPAYRQEARPAVPAYSRLSASPAAAAAAASPACPSKKAALPDAPTLLNRVANSFRGTVYDLKHWKHLPPVRASLGTKQGLKFVFGRDDRLTYIVLGVAVIMLMVSMIACIATGARKFTAVMATKL